MIETTTIFILTPLFIFWLWGAFNRSLNFAHNPKSENDSGGFTAIEYAPEIEIANKNPKEQVEAELQSNSGFT